MPEGFHVLAIRCFEVTKSWVAQNLRSGDVNQSVQWLLIYSRLIYESQLIFKWILAGMGEITRQVHDPDKNWVGFRWSRVEIESRSNLKTSSTKNVEIEDTEPNFWS